MAINYYRTVLGIGRKPNDDANPVDRVEVTRAYIIDR
jgi:hypothetical protein